MASEADKKQKEVIITPSILGYELNSKYNVIANYLVPSICGCILYILNFACDITVVYRHFHDHNPVWASLTVFFMYLPSLGCFIVVISSSELWPEDEGCGSKTVKWMTLKLFQHTFFPIWSMWRYAERIFWSVEGYRSEDEEERNKIASILSQPRSIELYFFFQAYLQAAPQILLQLHILMRFVQDLDSETVDAQAYSIVASIAKMALITTMFQRYKSQKIGGKHYPWFKPYKYRTVVDSSAVHRRSTIIYKPKASVRDSQDQAVTLRRPEQNDSSTDPPLPSRDLERRRRSSDFYEEPTNSYLDEMEQNDLKELDRETSVVGGPPRLILRDDDITETDFFNPKRLLEVKGLPEDDTAGKFISFLWWSCFLLARMLTISSFGYFYSSEIVWILASHFILVVALLLYDVTADEVRRAKPAFFIFIGFVYLFCLIEFKIKFKKVAFIYNGFFILMFTENFVMVFVWWFRDTEDIVNDWWYRYIFYVIIVSSVLSMLSMLLYVKVLKPQKVVVDVVPQN